MRFSRFVPALLMAAAAMNSLAQDLPPSPIRLLVGFAPGGGNDVIARSVATQFQLQTRETMVDVMRAADKLPPKVQALIKEQGVLYNPVVVRILHAFGTGLKEDGFVRPGASPAAEKKLSLDERLEMTFKGGAK